jgi:hypothetical protein
MLVLSYAFQLIGESMIEAIEKLEIQLREKDQYDREALLRKEKIATFLYNASRYLLSAKMLVLLALPLAADALRKNRKLVIALSFVMIAMLIEEFFVVQRCYYEDYSDFIYYENSYIMRMIQATLCYVSFAYLMYAYSQKDAQLFERGRLSAYDWATIVGVCLTTVFFFCNWMNYEDMYLTLGCHVVPFAAMGLMIMPLAILSILDSNDLGKKISSIALIAWPFVVGLATWIFEVNAGMTVGDIISKGSNMDNFKSEFLKATHLHYVLLYTLCSIASGIMILMKTFQTKLPADAPRKLTKDEEIAKLKADLEALKSQMKTLDTPVSEE